MTCSQTVGKSKTTRWNHIAIIAKKKPICLTTAEGGPATSSDKLPITSSPGLAALSHKVAKLCPAFIEFVESAFADTANAC